MALPHKLIDRRKDSNINQFNRVKETVAKKIQEEPEKLVPIYPQFNSQIHNQFHPIYKLVKQFERRVLHEFNARSDTGVSFYYKEGKYFIELLDSDMKYAGKKYPHFEIVDPEIIEALEHIRTNKF